MNLINQIVNGDCYSVIKEIPNDSIDLIIIDPPYQLSKSTTLKSDNNLSKSMVNLYKEFNSADVMNGISLNLLDELTRVMKRPNIYIWCNKKQILDYLQYFVGIHKCSFEIMVWIKSNPIPLCGRNYINDKEFCLYFRKGIPLTTTYETGKTYWISQTNKKDKVLYNHPTVKPEFIIEMLIGNSSKENDVVLDCFLGSGTTSAVAKRMKRNYIGIEKDPVFYQTAVDRVNSITN